MIGLGTALTAMKAIDTVGDVIGTGVELVGKGTESMGDAIASDPLESANFDPLGPVPEAMGAVTKLGGKGIGLGGKLLNGLTDIVSDEGMKAIDPSDKIQEILSELFFEYLQSPECLQALSSCKDDYIVSDIEQKLLKQYANKKEELSPRELRVLSYIMGKDENASKLGDGELSDDMIQEYADNLRNFLYQYKESAVDVDPSIDPSEYHRGPMAQDIEKVAPDCVKETAQGVKVVDGNRLALVNAGVIGDLARRLIDLEDAVYG